MINCCLQELAALWCAADEAPGLSRSMREAAAAITFGLQRALNPNFSAGRSWRRCGARRMRRPACRAACARRPPRSSPSSSPRRGA